MFENNLSIQDDFKKPGTEVKKKKDPENNLIVRSLNDPSSRKKAIHAQCFMCIGGTEVSFPDPGWRKEIGACRGQGCCIINFRPFQ